MICVYSDMLSFSMIARSTKTNMGQWEYILSIFNISITLDITRDIIIMYNDYS